MPGRDFRVFTVCCSELLSEFTVFYLEFNLYIFFSAKDSYVICIQDRRPASPALPWRTTHVPEKLKVPNYLFSSLQKLSK